MQESQHDSQAQHDDTAQLLIQTTQYMATILQGGIIAAETGNVKEGLAYVVAGLNGIATIVSRYPNQATAYRAIIDNLKTSDDQTLNMLMHMARSRTRTAS